MTNKIRLAFFILGLAIAAALFFTGASYTATISTINHNHQTTLHQIIILQKEVLNFIKEIKGK
jgi:predicted membrane protein